MTVKIYIARLAQLCMVCLLFGGCSGSHAKYAPSNNPWIGTRVTPMSPMAYITNLPNGFSDKEVIRIGRRLTTMERGEEDKRYERIMHEVIISPISAGATFEVIAVFTIVHNFFSRVFAHDFDVVVLQDNDGKKSTMLLSEFQEYVKEPAGGVKNETTTP